MKIRPKLVSVHEFARRNRVRPEMVRACMEAGRLPHVNGKINPVTAQPAWEALLKERHAHTIMVSPEVYADLQLKATKAGLSVPRYIRTQLGFPPSAEGPC